MIAIIVLKGGAEWGCEGMRGSGVAHGVFSRRADGTWQQHTGTGQTPAFRTPQQFSRYVHERYGTSAGARLPRMVGHDFWDDLARVVVNRVHKHRAVSWKTRGFSGPVRTPQNVAAHGNVCEIATCRCGASAAQRAQLSAAWSFDQARDYMRALRRRIGPDAWALCVTEIREALVAQEAFAVVRMRSSGVVLVQDMDTLLLAMRVVAGLISIEEALS